MIYITYIDGHINYTGKINPYVIIDKKIIASYDSLKKARIELFKYLISVKLRIYREKLKNFFRG